MLISGADLGQVNLDEEKKPVKITHPSTRTILTVTFFSRQREEVGSGMLGFCQTEQGVIWPGKWVAWFLDDLSVLNACTPSLILAFQLVSSLRTKF